MIPNEPKIGATLRMPGYRGRIGIETRAQSSQQFPKKSFAIELRDARGDDRKAPLLGMPADGDWVLYAPYNDKTLMRNVVAYRTARWMGRYAARTRFVRVRLNGRAHGVYVLMEKLELGDERVQGEALLEFTLPFQAQSKAPSFQTPVKRRPIVWEDPERGDLSRDRRFAARLDRAQLPPLARAGPAGLAQPRRPRQPHSRAAVPAWLAEAAHRLDRPGSGPPVNDWRKFLRAPALEHP